MLNLFYFFKILISLSNYIGSCLRLRTDEYDQIIKFHFTESIFDIFLLSSIKSIILIISIAELELAVVRIASLSNTFQQVSDQSLETSTNSDGFRSWLFELAGQRVVARLRQQGNWHI